MLTRREFLKFTTMAAIGVAGTSLIGCGSSVSTKAKQLEQDFYAGSEDVQKFTDSCGREGFLPKEINCISPSGAMAQILLATLCPDKLVSLTSKFSKSQMRYLNSRFSDLPALGRLYGQNGDLNYESLIKLDPDVVIDVGEAKQTIEEDMDALQEKTGLPCIFVEGTAASFASAYATLGSVLGVDAHAAELANEIRSSFDYANSKASEIAARNLRVVYACGTNGYEVKTKGSLHGAVLDTVGVNNLAEITDTNSTEVTPEQMLAWNPDYLLLSPEEGFFEEIYSDEVWASISAVQKHQVYEVPTGPYEWLDRPPSIQQTLGIKWLGNLLAPDVYDFDMISETKNFYSKFWGCTLTDDDVRSMLANSTFLN